MVVIERDPDIYFRARAISTDEEVLRIWQQVGLADRLNADMQPGAGANFVDPDGAPIIGCFPWTAATATRHSSSSTSRRWTRSCAGVDRFRKRLRSCSSTNACGWCSIPTASS